MFNKNIFTQKDPIAEAIAKIAEADYKAKMEELKGQQHKIDKNKNNKIDAHDFAILRGEKKSVKEEQVEEGWDDMMKAVKARSGPQPSGGAGVKKGRAYGGAAQKSKPEQDDADKKMKKEEVEQIDEISVETMKSAKEKLANKAYDAHMDDNKAGARHYAGRALNMADKIKKKEKQVAKEEVELDERTLTKGETAEKERIVKGMKKSLAGFKARYGDKAKSVMYATATKAAKKD